LRRVAVVGVAAMVLAACDPVNWGSRNDWNRFTQIPISNPLNTVSLSVGPAGSQVGRITENGTEANDRRWWVLNSPVSRDGEILALWRGHSRWSSGGGQRGQVLRAQRLADGTTTGYVVWHDYVFGQDQMVHAAVWFSNGGTNFRYTYLGGAAFDFMKSTVATVDATRTANVATLQVNPGHGVDVGDTMVVDVVDASFDGVAKITGVGPASVSYADPGPNTMTGGPGTSQNLDGVAPYWVRSRVVGRTLAIKVWPDGQPEPPWADPVHVRVFEDSARVGPSGAGKAGILAGHIRGGASVEYGPVEVTSLDGTSPSPLDATTPTAADRVAMLTVTGDAGLPVIANGQVP
jgi:hypothetical protein